MIDSVAMRLVRLRADAWSGRLRVSVAGGAVDLGLRAGRICGIDAEACSRLLLASLFEKGTLTEDAVVDARMELPDDAPLLASLIKASVLSEAVVTSECAQLAARALAGVLARPASDVDWIASEMADESIPLAPLLAARQLRPVPDLEELLPGVERARKGEVELAALSPDERTIWRSWSEAIDTHGVALGPELGRRLYLAGLLQSWLEPIVVGVEPPLEAEVEAPASSARFTPVAGVVRRDFSSQMQAPRVTADGEGDAVYKDWERLTKASLYEVLDAAPRSPQSVLKDQYEGRRKSFSTERGSFQARLYRRKIVEEIDFAYKILGDPEKRKLHDRLQREYPQLRIGAREIEQAEIRDRVIKADLEAATQRERAGNISEAIHFLQQVLSFDPSNLDVLARLARCQAQMPSTRPAAIETLSRIVRLEPARTDSWLELGRLHLTRNAWADAEQCFGRVLAYEPSSREAREGLAKAQAKTK